MKIFLVYLVIFSFSLFLFQSEIMASGDCSNQYKIGANRVEEIQKLFDIQSKNDNIGGMINLWKSHSLLKKDGILYSVGAHMNFYEWALPLLIRPDIKIVLFELNPRVLPFREDGSVVIDFPGTKSPFTLNGVWNLIKINNPEIIRNSETTNIEKFKEAFDQRVVFGGAIENTHFGIGTQVQKYPLSKKNEPIELADLVTINQINFPGVLQTLKGRVNPNGAVWVAADRKLQLSDSSDIFNSISIKQSEVAKYLQPGSHGHDSPGLFRGFETAADSYILLPH
ncbi:MAG: hypothetical protein AB8E15_12575 [Bdellovibrionales bacterium]